MEIWRLRLAAMCELIVSNAGNDITVTITQILETFLTF